ncbi:hypothetical protein PVAG01_05543 [Phlyctema vagabunda]|uniref:Uncharacterized protein n=1 Tax=Phlyctema vagabunda TaxID=108571 RepID=A0ABR4PKC6_9HELO
MFLHSGASFHGHEYSVPAPSSSQSRARSVPKRPLLRPTFSTPVTRAATIYENPIPTILQRQRPISDYRPKNTTIENIVRFQEPDGDTMSEDARSVANSETSETTAGGGRRRRRTVRSSTALHLAHPAPTLATQKQKLIHVRPKLLLQLQQLSPGSRPKPVIDVLPSFVIIPRLLKKFPRMFRGRCELGANDVMVVRSEDYDAFDQESSEGPDSDEEGLASRDLLAVICQVAKAEDGSQGGAEITLKDGTIWKASPMARGSFEFTSTNLAGQRTTARWVRKALPPSNNDEPATGLPEYKFNFSMIDPNSRRHPIMATITQKTLDIPDFYTSVSASAGTFPPPSPLPAGYGLADHQAIDEDITIERTVKAIDETTKALIQVTGVWIALRENWSPYFRYSEPCIGASTTPRNISHGRVRSLSYTPDASRLILNGSSSPDSPKSTFGPTGKILKKSQTKCLMGTGSPPNPSHSVPKRSVSAGTAFMQRAAARKGTTAPSTVASDSEGEHQRPQHAATDPTTSGNHTLTPTIQLPASPTTSPDSPTKVPRRKSALFPSTRSKHLSLEAEAPRVSFDVVDIKKLSDYGERRKDSRWRTFTGLFRRGSRKVTSTGEI